MDKKIWKDGKVTVWTKQLHDDVTKTSQLQDQKTDIARSNRYNLNYIHRYDFGGEFPPPLLTWWN